MLHLAVECNRSVPRRLVRYVPHGPTHSQCDSLPQVLYYLHLLGNNSHKSVERQSAQSPPQSTPRAHAQPDCVAEEYRAGTRAPRAVALRLRVHRWCRASYVPRTNEEACIVRNPHCTTGNHLRDFVGVVKAVYGGNEPEIAELPVPVFKDSTLSLRTLNDQVTLRVAFSCDVVCCMLHAACCMRHVARCMLHIARALLCVGTARSPHALPALVLRAASPSVRRSLCADMGRVRHSSYWAVRFLAVDESTVAACRQVPR